MEPPVLPPAVLRNLHSRERCTYPLSLAALMAGGVEEVGGTYQEEIQKEFHTVQPRGYNPCGEVLEVSGKSGKEGSAGKWSRGWSAELSSQHTHNTSGLNPPLQIGEKTSKNPPLPTAGKEKKGGQC